MVVFMEQLSGKMPPTGSLPAIGTVSHSFYYFFKTQPKFFVASMIIITASLVTTVFCLSMHQKEGEEARNMPNWVRQAKFQL